MKVKTLQQTHPSFDGKRLERLRALHEGGKAWHDLLGTWLPKREVEPPDVYAERQAMAGYNNHAGPLLSVLSAALFSDAPTIEGVEGDYWAAFWDDCDGKGTPFRRFWRDRLDDAQVGRYAYAWVNLPARGKDTAVGSKADEEAAGLLDAYLVGLLPEQVIDWWEDERGKLTGVMVRDTVSRRAGPDSPRVTVWRWTHIDQTTIRRWEWTPPSDGSKTAPTDEDNATELGAITHNVGRLPVVRLALPPGLWTMGKLEDPAVSATRARNEHTWALHQAANELLVVTSRWNDKKISIGHGHYAKLERDDTGKDEINFVGPSGVAFQYLQQDVRDTREEVFRAVQQMAMAADSDATRTRQSGESKAQDWKALDIILGAFQDLCLGVMKDAVELLAKARGETPTELNVTGLDGWQTEDLTLFLEASALAVDAHQLSPTFRKLVAKRQVQRLLQDEVAPEDLQKVLDEIDAAEDDPAPVTPIRRGGQAEDGDDEDDDDLEA